MTEDKANSKAENNSANSDEKSVNVPKTDKNATKSGEVVVSGAVESNSTNQSAKTKPPHDKKAAKVSSKQAFVWGIILVLFLIAALAGGNYWQYQQGQQLNQFLSQVTQRQGEMDQQIGSISSQLTELEDQYKSTVEKLDNTEQAQHSVKATLDQMSQQLKSLSTAKGKEPLFWRVSEVEYLLSVANVRLNLERDITTAKTALTDADKRLRVIGDPGLIPVRERISQEINQLEQVSLPDIPGLAAKLGSVTADIGQLPFVKKSISLEPAAVDEEQKDFSGVANLAQSVWNDLSNGLFRVQRSDQPIEPLLPPEEKQYLVHNLRLKVEQARMALLKKDTDLFRLNLTDMEQWVQNYFDVEQPSVNRLLLTVQELKQTELDPSLPDISGSLRELRTWIEVQQLNISMGNLKANERLLTTKFTSELSSGLSSELSTGRSGQETVNP